MKQLMLPTLLAAGLALGAQAAGDFTIQPLSGTVEQKRLGDEIVLTVRSNSQLRVTGSGKIDILLIGGGGGGGGAGGGNGGGGGGGGGGGFVYTQSVDVVAGTYDIAIGAGGAVNKNGGNSTAFDLTAYGGGAGGHNNVGADGASGGGGGTPIYTSTTIARRMGGAAIYGDQGYPGGDGTNLTVAAGSSNWKNITSGGGGGAGGPGGNGGRQGSNGCYKGGLGGAARVCDITGVNQEYAGGGGGFSTDYGIHVDGGTGGGKGSCATWNGSAVGTSRGTDGTDWLGGGGGAAGYIAGNVAAGGRGGCGVVIIRYTPKSGGKAYDRGMATGGETRLYRKYEYHTFTNGGTFTVSKNAFVDLLLVGGGGAGGWYAGGGGGGGGVSVLSNVYMAAGTYAVTVGVGGKGDKSSTPQRISGGASSVSGPVVAYSVEGGGGGGCRSSGAAGASGGGGSGLYSAKEGRYFGGAGLSGYGFDGGSSTNSNTNWKECYGGGGGGAGGPGEDGTKTTLSGDGGIGVSVELFGVTKWFGGGGGGGASGSRTGYYISKGGSGGGGRGCGPYFNSKDQQWYQHEGESALPNTGGGGGGGSAQSDGYAKGGDGGSGIVVIRYRVKRPGLLVELRCK